jgi:hypothetical protein
MQGCVALVKLYITGPTGFLHVKARQNWPHMVRWIKKCLTKTSIFRNISIKNSYIKFEALAAWSLKMAVF